MSSGFHFLTFTIFDCFKIISRSLNRYSLVRFVNKSSFIHKYFYIQLLRFQSETIRNIVRLSCAVSVVSLIFIFSYSIVSLIFYFFLYIFPRIYKIISRYALISVKTIAKVEFSHYTRKYDNVSLVAAHLPVDLAFPKIIICQTVRDFI